MGICACSAGNHAQGVAFSAAALDTSVRLGVSRVIAMARSVKPIPEAPRVGLRAQGPKGPRAQWLLHVFTSFKACFVSLRQAKIFMPRTTPNIKVDAVRRRFVAAGRSQLDDFQRRSRNAVTVPICLYHPISMYDNV